MRKATLVWAFQSTLCFVSLNCFSMPVQAQDAARDEIYKEFKDDLSVKAAMTYKANEDPYFLMTFVPMAIEALAGSEVRDEDYYRKNIMVSQEEVRELKQQVENPDSSIASFKFDEALKSPKAWHRFIQHLPEGEGKVALGVQLLKAITGVATEVEDIAGEDRGVRAEKRFDAQQALDNAYGLDNDVATSRIINLLLKAAEKDPKFRAAFNSFYKQTNGFGIKAKAPEVLDALGKDFENSLALKLVLEKLNTGKLTQAELKKLFTEQMQLAQGKLDDVLAAFKVMQEGSEKEKREAAEAKAAEIKWDEHETFMKEAQSSVYLISTVLGFADKKAGQQLQVAGNEMLKVIDSIVRVTTNDVGQKISAIVFSGNMVSAAMAIAGMMMSQGPSIEEVILEQIGKLFKEVQTVRAEMNARFNRIERQLSENLDITLNAFERLAKMQQVTQRLILDVQRDLAAVAQSLAFMHQDFQQAFEEVITEESELSLRKVWFWQDMVADQMDPETYRDLVFRIENYGSELAKKSTLAGPEVNNEAEFLNVLNGRRGTSYKLNALAWYARLLAEKYKQPSSPGLSTTIANPTIWVAASKTLGKLIFDWPSHTSLLQPTILSDLIVTGQEIEGLQQELASSIPLFIKHYQSKLDLFIAAVRRVGDELSQSPDAGISTSLSIDNLPLVSNMHFKFATDGNTGVYQSPDSSNPLTLGNLEVGKKYRDYIEVKVLGYCGVDGVRP